LVALAQGSCHQDPYSQEREQSPCQRRFNSDFCRGNQGLRRGFYDRYNRFDDYDRYDYDRYSMADQYPYGFDGFYRRGDFDRQAMRREFYNPYNRFSNRRRFDRF